MEEITMRILKIIRGRGGFNISAWKFKVLIFIFLLYNHTFAFGEGGLQGRAFSDPAVRQIMPEEWKERAIRHDPHIKPVQDIVVTFDQHLCPLLRQHIKDYGKNHNLKIEVREGTCGISLGKLEKKMVDIGGFCCPAGEIDRLPGLQFHTIGISPLLIIVHPENPLKDIEMDMVRQIFMGIKYTWSDIIPDATLKVKFPVILPIGRLHCKKRPGHWRLILANEDLFSSRMKEVGSIVDMISLVSSNRGAIGYETDLMVKRYRKIGEVKTLTVNGYDPGVMNNLLTRKYPLYRTYSITVWQDEHTRNKEVSSLLMNIKKIIHESGDQMGIIPFSRLKEAGWLFEGSELIGEPE